MSNYTEQDLKTIQRALASGARKVKFQGREIEYMSYAQMRALEQEIKAELGKETAPRRSYFQTGGGQ